MTMNNQDENNIPEDTPMSPEDDENIDRIMNAMNANAAAEAGEGEPEAADKEEKPAPVVEAAGDKYRDAIADKYDARQLEGKDAQSEAIEADPYTGDEEGYPEADATDAELEAHANPAPEPEPETFTLKVNGVETQVSREELIANAQMNLAADQKLDKAKELYAAVKNGALPAEVTPDAPQAEQPAQESVEAQEGDETNQPVDFVALAEQLQLGSPEEAAEALKQTLETLHPGNAMSISDSNVRELVEAEINARAERQESDTALRDFAQSNKDLTADPHLRQVTLDNIYTEMVKDMLAAGHSKDDIGNMIDGPETLMKAHSYMRRNHNGNQVFRDHATLYNAAGNETRQWIKATKGATPGGKPAPTREQRQAAKAGIAPQPAGRGRGTPKAAQGKPRTPAQDRKAAVREAAKERGQIYS